MLLDTEQALNSGAMAIFTDLLNSESSHIKTKAARVIFDLRYFKKKTVYFVKHSSSITAYLAKYAVEW
jgi:hypothetical protein